jgi:hypothetical protein
VWLNDGHRHFSADPTYTLAHPKSHLCPLPPHAESVSLGEKINSYNLLQIEDSHPRIGGVVLEDDTAVIGESQADDSFV